MSNPKRLATLIKDLESRDISKRRMAATLLGDGDERAIYPLIRALSDSSPAVQDAAMRSLILIGGEVTAYMAIPILRRGAAQRNAALMILKELGRTSVPLLYDLLKDYDDDMRKFALDLLGDIKENVNAKKIIPAMKDSNPNVRAAACRALGLIEAHEHVELLKEALNDEEWVAFTAVEALGSLANEDAVEAIHNLVNRNSELLTIAALETLGKIQTKRSKKALLACIQYCSPLERSVALKSLVQLGVEPDMKHIAVDLLEMLSSEDWEDKAIAIDGLKSIREKSAIRILIDMAGAFDTSLPEDEERYDITMNALCEIADCAALIELLKDEGFKFRGKAILVDLLGRLRCSEAIDELIMLLRGSYRDIRRGAAKALVEISDERCVESLVDALGDNDCHVKLQVIYALRKLKNPKAYIPIANLLKTEKCEDVIEEGVKAVLGLRHDESIREIAYYSDTVRQFVAKYADDEDLLLELSHDTNDAVKITAVSRLSSFPGERMHSRIEEVMNDHDSEIRKVAVMGFIQSRNFSPVLLSALNDKDIWVRFYAVKALAAIGGEEYVQYITDALKDDAIPVVLGAMEALANIGGPDVYDALSSLTDHWDESVKEKANEVLQSL